MDARDTRKIEHITTRSCFRVVHASVHADEVGAKRDALEELREYRFYRSLDRTREKTY